MWSCSETPQPVLAHQTAKSSWFCPNCIRFEFRVCTAYSKTHRATQIKSLSQWHLLQTSWRRTPNDCSCHTQSNRSSSRCPNLRALPCDREACRTSARKVSQKHHDIIILTQAKLSSYRHLAIISLTF